MTHHITADRLVESAIKAVTEELFRDFDNTLRTLCDEEDDRKAVFRTLRYARILLRSSDGVCGTFSVYFAVPICGSGKKCATILC